MNPLDLAYFAGLFDGEGSVVIAKYKKPKCARGYLLKIMATLSNNHRDVLEELKHEYGGSITLHRYSSNPNQGRDNWQYALVARQSKRFLQDLLPYLRMKKEQARLALEFQQRLRTCGKTRLSDEEWQIREQYRQQIRELNSRFNGRNDLSRPLSMVRETFALFPQERG